MLKSKGLLFLANTYDANTTSLIYAGHFIVYLGPTVDKCLCAACEGLVDRMFQMTALWKREPLKLDLLWSALFS